MTNPMFEYSQWLFNRYVEAVKSPNGRLRNQDTADIMFNALQRHLECNLQGKRLGYARQWTKSLIKEISKNRRDPEKFPIDYYGDEGDQLRAKDKVLWEQKLKQWENDHDQAISMVSDQTEVKALRLAARIIKSFAEFQNLRMTSIDDACACGAANLLLRIIHANQYELNQDPKSKRTIIKIQQS